VYRNNKEVRVIAMISDLRYRSTRGGGQMVSVTVEDGSTKINAVVFSKVLSSVSDKLIVDNVVLISGKINKDYRDQWQLVVEKIQSIDEEKMKYAKSFEVALDNRHHELLGKLSDILLSNKGRCPVKLNFHLDGSQGDVSLGNKYNVSPNQQLVDEVDTLLGSNLSKIQYH
jgi:DNA polymerase-3 subunit alpha